MELNRAWEMRVEFGKFRSKSWDIGNFPLVTLPLKPDAMPVDPRARPEPPALRDTGGCRRGDGTGVIRSRREASERRNASGRQEAGGNSGRQHGGGSSGRRDVAGCRDPGGSSGRREAAGCRHASGGSGRRGSEGTGGRAGNFWIGVRAGGLGSARCTGNFGGSNSGRRELGPLYRCQSVTEILLYRKHTDTESVFVFSSQDFLVFCRSPQISPAGEVSPSSPRGRGGLFMTPPRLGQKGRKVIGRTQVVGIMLAYCTQR